MNIEKYLSRKFLAAAAGVVSGLAIVFGADGAIVSSVAGATVSVASVVTYIIAEGRIDAAAVKNALEDIKEAGEALAKPETVSSLPAAEEVPQA